MVVTMNYLYLAQGTDSDIWMQIVENDFGCLAQGIKKSNFLYEHSF